MLAADCEMASLHPEEEENMQNRKKLVAKMKKKGR